MTTSTRSTVLVDKEDALARARALLPNFRERVALTEQLRKVPNESVAELHAAGLFGIIVPRRWGRSELTLDALVDVAIEIFSACAATGWVYSLISMHPWWASLFDDSNDFQRIFRDVNAAAAHGGLAWDTAGLFYGRLASGLPPSSYDRSGRPIAYLPGLT